MLKNYKFEKISNGRSIKNNNEICFSFSTHDFQKKGNVSIKNSIKMYIIEIFIDMWTRHKIKSMKQ